MARAILVVGNVAEGFRFVGPFDSPDDAAIYDDYALDGCSWVATLEAPTKQDEPS